MYRNVTLNFELWEVFQHYSSFYGLGYIWVYMRLILKKDATIRSYNVKTDPKIQGNIFYT